MNFIKLGIGPLVGGMMFAVGLSMSGMTEPQKIINFFQCTIFKNKI